MYETDKLTCLGLWMVNLFLWTGDLMTIYNGYIQDPIWRKPCIKIATSFNAGIDILSYMLEIYSHHGFITEYHFTKKERQRPRRCTMHQNCTPRKVGGGKRAYNHKTNWKYKCWAGNVPTKPKHASTCHTSVKTSLSGMLLTACFFQAVRSNHKKQVSDEFSA